MKNLFLWEIRPVSPPHGERGTFGFFLRRRILILENNNIALMGNFVAHEGNKVVLFVSIFYFYVRICIYIN